MVPRKHGMKNPVDLGVQVIFWTLEYLKWLIISAMINMNMELACWDQSHRSAFNSRMWSQLGIALISKRTHHRNRDKVGYLKKWIFEVEMFSLSISTVEGTALFRSSVVKGGLVRRTIISTHFRMKMPRLLYDHKLQGRCWDRCGHSKSLKTSWNRRAVGGKQHQCAVWST